MRPAELDDPDRQVWWIPPNNTWHLLPGQELEVRFSDTDRHKIIAERPGPMPFLIGMVCGLLEGAAIVGFLVWLF